MALLSVYFWFKVLSIVSDVRVFKNVERKGQLYMRDFKYHFSICLRVLKKRKKFTNGSSYVALWSSVRNQQTVLNQAPSHEDVSLA
jgi:hypothetical protein